MRNFAPTDPGRMTVPASSRSGATPGSSPSARPRSRTSSISASSSASRPRPSGTRRETSTPSRRGDEGERRPGMGRRLVSESLRLGVQGGARQSQKGVRPVAAVPGGSGEPAAPRRLRPRPLRGSHQLHRHRQASLRLRPGDARPAGASGRAARPLGRPRLAQAEDDGRGGHRAGGRALRGAGRGPARAGGAPERAAHFLVQLLFCLFAEDAGLLPKGLFSRLLAFCADAPEEFPAQITALLEAMRDGGSVAFQRVARFNGGLFARVDVVPLTGRSCAAWPMPPRSTGGASSRRSSAPSSSARSTPASGRSSGRTTPSGGRSSGWWSRSCSPRCAGARRTFAPRRRG